MMQIPTDELEMYCVQEGSRKQNVSDSAFPGTCLLVPNKRRWLFRSKEQVQSNISAFYCPIEKGSKEVKMNLCCDMVCYCIGLVLLHFCHSGFPYLKPYRISLKLCTLNSILNAFFQRWFRQYREINVGTKKKKKKVKRSKQTVDWHVFFLD